MTTLEPFAWWVPFRLGLGAVFVATVACSADPAASAEDAVDVADTAIADTAVADTAPPPSAPPHVFLTMARIPEHLNGSTPYEDADGVLRHFRHRVNAERVMLTVWVDPAAGPAESLEVVCEPGGDVRVPGPSYDGDPSWRDVVYTHDAPLPMGEGVVCTAVAANALGEATSTLVVDSEPMPANLDPRPRPDRWVLDFDRDHYTLEQEVHRDGTATVQGSLGGDGRSDFEDAMMALGLLDPTGDPLAYERMKGYLRDTILNDTRGCFDLFGRDEPAVEVWTLGEPDAPTPSPGLVAEGHVSTLGLGGFGPSPEGCWGFAEVGAFVTGTATVDPNNQFADDLSGDPMLGVFVGCMVALALASPTFAGVFAHIMPQVGEPFGQRPGDAQLLAPDFDPEVATADERARRNAVLGAADMGIAYTVANVCHEIGHSLGLVPNGPPPGGLFGGIAGPAWAGPESTPGHLDLGGNLMTARSGVEGVPSIIFTTPRFATLTAAYLDGQLIVGADTATARVVAESAVGERLPGVTVCADEGATCRATLLGGVTELDGLPSNQPTILTATGPGLLPTTASALGNTHSPHLTVWLRLVDTALAETWASASGWDQAEGRALVAWIADCTWLGSCARRGVSADRAREIAGEDGWLVEAADLDLVAPDEASDADLYLAVVWFDLPVGVFERRLPRDTRLCVTTQGYAGVSYPVIMEPIVDGHVTVTTVFCYTGEGP